MSVFEKIISLLIGLLIGYFFAATRNWVWCPDWLKHWVLDEKNTSKKHGA